LGKRFVRKLGWSWVALFVPEGALAVAMYKRGVARLLKNAIKKTYKDDNTDRSKNY